MKLLSLLPYLLIGTDLFGQPAVEVVPVLSKNVERQVKLPGEFLPFLSVPIHAKVSGFIKTVRVDKGSLVRKGEVLVTLEAPEMQAQIAEAESKAHTIELQKAEAEARLAAAQSTFEHLKSAAQTPGVVAGNDLVVAEKNFEAAQAEVHAQEGVLEAAEATVGAQKDLVQYLTITAPFDGIITERNIHPGALVGPAAGSGSEPLLRLEQNSRLRLVVSVPEQLAGDLATGLRLPFKVPAFPSETFYGALTRIPHSLDEKTRSMAVELDVSNPGLRLAPGMYAEVNWLVRPRQPILLVPATSVVTTTERMFVIQVKNGVAEWVNVTTGSTHNDMVEIRGPIHEGDMVVKRGSDEIRDGSSVRQK